MSRSVVFDIGNVVCTFDPHVRLRELARVSGLAPAEIHEAIWGSGLEARAEVGELSPADTERLLLAALEDRVDAATLRAAWSTAFTADPVVCELARRLDQPAFAFTNNGPMFTACLEYELEPVDDLFERVICSWQVHARKPDAAAFERLCAEVDREPEELLFIDDDELNVASARCVGLAAERFTGAEHLADILASAAT